MSPFVLRRVKEDVVADLPEKIEDTVMAQLTGEQRKLYLANQDRIAQQVQHRESSEFKKDKLKVLAELTKLRQICCDPRLHYEDYKAGSAKLDTRTSSRVNNADEMPSPPSTLLTRSRLDSCICIMRSSIVSLAMSLYTVTVCC